MSAMDFCNHLHFAGAANYIFTLQRTAFLLCNKQIEELFSLGAAADRRFETSTKEPLIRNTACFLILIRMLAGCGFRINEFPTYTPQKSKGGARMGQKKNRT